MPKIFKSIEVTYKGSVKHRAVALNEWELQTNNNVIDANKEVNGAKQLRCYIDTIIKQTIDNLNKQKNVTNEAFKQRIEQTRETKIKLEFQHSEVKQRIIIFIQILEILLLNNKLLRFYKVVSCFQSLEQNLRGRISSINF